MILPVYGYGEPVLRKHCEEITKDHPNLKEIIANMYETMYNAYGVGLAAPQVGMSIRLFVIDTTPFGDDEDLHHWLFSVAVAGLGAGLGIGLTVMYLNRR